MRMSIIRFKEPQQIITSLNTQIGVGTTSIDFAANKDYQVELDTYGDYSDIKFLFDNGDLYAYAVPNELFEVI